MLIVVLILILILIRSHLAQAIVAQVVLTEAMLAQALLFKRYCLTFNIAHLTNFHYYYCLLSAGRPLWFRCCTCWQSSHILPKRLLSRRSRMAVETKRIKISCRMAMHIFSTRHSSGILRIIFRIHLQMSR